MGTRTRIASRSSPQLWFFKTPTRLWVPLASIHHRNMSPPLPWVWRWLRPQSFLFRPDACLDGLGGRRTERAGGLGAGGWELGLTGCCKGVGWSLLPGKPQTAWGAGAQNGLGGWGWGLQDAAGVPPRVSPILRLRPGAGAVGRGAAANHPNLLMRGANGSRVISSSRASESSG